MFENRVLRRIFGPKRDEVTGKWRKLHNEKLNDLYSSPNIIRVIKPRRKMGGACSACGGGGAYRVLVGKSDAKRPIGRLKHRWEYNIKMELQDMGWDVTDWIDLTEGRGRW